MTGPSPARVRVGDFVFDRSTGELRRLDGAGAPSRLPPQPARLLALLIEKNGELATREEIRERVWPDTHVDFDASLHFCVRRIRSAFGDSATQPTYVETLPRRGYRLMRSVDPVPEAEAADRAEAPSEPPEAPRSWLRQARSALLGVLALIVIAAAFGLARGGRDRPAEPRPRLAIMPFELASADGDASDLAPISEWLVAEMSHRWADRVDVIGPRSTARYSALPFPDLRRMAADLSIDYVINAREVEDEGERQLIVELIRWPDGAHPWAAFFERSGSWNAVAGTTLEEVAAVLDLPTEPAPSEPR